jgi:hypothetical protein
VLSLASFGFASVDMLFDLFVLDLVFLALRYRPGFGPLAVAYPAANIAGAIPLTPGGLGVVKVSHDSGQSLRAGGAALTPASPGRLPPLGELTAGEAFGRAGAPAAVRARPR